MTRKKGKSTPINYAAIIRISALAEKILKYSYSEAGEAQNKPDDLMILSALVRIRKRLDDLSQKVLSAKAGAQVLCNVYRKTLVESRIASEAKLDKGFLMSWTKVRNEARSIFKEATGAGIKLPSVPAGDGTAWSFERLQNWIDKSLLCKISPKLQKYICKITSGGKTGDNIQAASEPVKGTRKIKAIRDQVFICYSHKDKRWLEDLETHLKPYVRNGSITARSDKQIATGSKWLKEIEVALVSAKVAVLLVTPNFLASDFIHEKELGPLLKKAEKGKVTIIWIPVRACSYKETPLKDYQAAIDPEKPLANMKAERDKSWVKICEEIKKATCA